MDTEGDGRLHRGEVHQLLLMLERWEDVQRPHPQIQVGAAESIVGVGGRAEDSWRWSGVLGDVGEACREQCLFYLEVISSAR